MPMYNLIEHRDDPNYILTNSESFKFKMKIT